MRVTKRLMAALLACLMLLSLLPVPAYAADDGRIALLAVTQDGYVIEPEYIGYRSGDTVKVHLRIVEGEKERIQVFQGNVIRIQRGTTDATFTVRKISDGVGVERIFPLHSPFIDHVEVVSQGRVRRSRLYYLRALKGKAARIKPRGRF